MKAKIDDVVILKDVSKSFKGHTVLDDISISFERNKIHGIVGRNGSGKTVLIKTICGFVKPDEGEVIVDGEHIGEDVDFPESAGAIIETIEFIPYMSAYQNLADIAAMRGNLSKTQIKEVLEMVGLGNVGRKHVSKFSMGMRQRLAIAQAVMESPKLLILDEPMNGMDEKGVEEMRQLILARKAAGTTIVLSSHNIEDIRILCDQVYRIDAGVVMREVE